MPQQEIVKDMVFYNGMHVDKNHFRVFIYGENNEKKLVNNYDEFIDFMQTGVWFESKEAAQAHNDFIEDNLTVDKPPKKRTNLAHL